jgi:hypothetical protein
MLKSCVHFRTLEDLPLDVIGVTIAPTGMQEFVRQAKEIKRTTSPRCQKK